MKYVVKKMGVLIIMLFLVSFITFIAFSVIPGDSALSTLGIDATEEAIEALRESLGYNDPIPVRYFHWVKDAVRGDFGTSTKYNQKVSQLIGDKLPVTISLAVMAFVFISIFGVLLGIWIAKAKSKKIQNLIAFVTQIFMSIPPFFLGMILTLIFGIILRWFTPGGYVSYKDSIGEFLYYLIYPAMAMAIPKISMVAKFTASSIRRETKLDYVRTAYSKGNTRNQVFYHHIVRNSMMPVVTFLGMVMADVLAGSIIVEQVFNLPGLGRLLVTSIGTRDLYVVQAIVLYIVTVVIVVNFIVDIIYQIIDPRVRV